MFRKANVTWCWVCPLVAALLAALLWSTPVRAEFELELGTVIDANAANDEMLFVITLDGPGMLTVVARPPQGQELGQDITLSLFDSEGNQVHNSDSDLEGMLWNELFTIPVTEPGDYVIEVGSIGTPGMVRVGASFISMPGLQGPVGKELVLGVGQSDVVVGATNYTIDIPEGDDGYLSVFTRGESGDIALEIQARGGAVLDSVDSDMGGSLVNEAIFTQVEGGNRYTVRVRALQDNTAYSIYAHFIPESVLPEPGEMANTLIGTEMPSIALLSLDGEEINISENENRVVVIDFWATWCGPCREALPQLVEVQQFIADEGLPVSLYAVNVGEDQVLVEEFLAAEALDLPVLLDPEDMLSTPLQIEAFPTTIVLLDGKVHRVHVGGGEEYFDNLVDDILEAVATPLPEEPLVEPDVEVEAGAEVEVFEQTIETAPETETTSEPESNE